MTPSLYGGFAGIAWAAAHLQKLEQLDPGDAGHDERWRLALCGSDISSARVFARNERR
jgi:hypothetical protein